MELLLKKGAQINALNNGGCSTLHVAVNKQHAECVRILLKNKCNVNIQVNNQKGLYSKEKTFYYYFLSTSFCAFDETREMIYVIKNLNLEK